MRGTTSIELKDNPELGKRLLSLLNLLTQVCAMHPEVKKLTDHPIQEWTDYISEEFYFDSITPFHFVMMEKESVELHLDFKSSKNTKLVKLVEAILLETRALCQEYADPIHRSEYLKSRIFTPLEIDSEELSSVRFLRGLK